MAQLQEAVQEAVREESFAELDSKDQELRAQTSLLAEISWSSIVKKSISPSSDSQEVRKETDLEPLIEVEEKPEASEHARKLEETEFRDRDNPAFFEATRRAMCERENTRRRTCKTKEDKEEEEKQEEKEKEEGEEEEEEEFLFGEKDNVDVMKTATTTVEESILVDFHAPIVDEEPRADKDVARVTTAMARAKISRNKGDNKATEGSSLLAPEVRSVVDETRRGNVAAERRESQRESSLQLQPTQWQQQVGGGDGTTGTSERYDPASSKAFLESGHRLAEKRNEAEREAPGEHSTAAKKTTNRSKRKKRR